MLAVPLSLGCHLVIGFFVKKFPYRVVYILQVLLAYHSLALSRKAPGMGGLMYHFVATGATYPSESLPGWPLGNLEASTLISLFVWVYHLGK